MQIIVDSLLTSYVEIGTGKKTILFLHGWADSGKTFTGFATQLVKENPEYTAVLLDLPGFGATNAPKDAWGLADYATFVAHFIAKTKKQPQVIVGHSNGGAIAINALASGVVTADKLILIGSAGIRVKTAKKSALRLLSKPVKLALNAAPQSTQKQVKKKLYSAIGSDYLIAEHMQETFKNVVAHDVRAEAASIAIPVCLIYGEDDTSTPPSYGQILSQAIPRSELHVIPLTGHFVHQEQVYKVATISSEFIKKATP